jgi:hypothetical protein
MWLAGFPSASGDTFTNSIEKVVRRPRTTARGYRMTRSTACFIAKCDDGSADRVGNCVVFDVGNNRYRLIGRVFYPYKLYVLRVMDHQEYSRNAWAKQCGCHNPPPTRSVATMRANRRTKRVPGSRGKRGE